MFLFVQAWRFSGGLLRAGGLKTTSFDPFEVEVLAALSSHEVFASRSALGVGWVGGLLLFGRCRFGFQKDALGREGVRKIERGVACFHVFSGKKIAKKRFIH